MDPGTNLKLTNTMKIKSPYRRPSRRLSRRSENGPFSPQESAEPSFFQTQSHADLQAKSEDSGYFFSKESEEEASKCKEEEETAAKEEEEEAAQAKEEEEEAAQSKEEEEEATQAKEEEEEAAQPKEEEEEASAPKEEEEAVQAKEQPREDSSANPQLNSEKCNRRRRSKIDSALARAKMITNKAIDVVSAARAAGEDGSDATEKYEAWFGPMDMDRSLFVLNVFRSISQDLSSSSLKFSCDCRRKSYAYVHPKDSALEVFLCRYFWSKAGEGGINSRGGVLIHELSHEAHENVGDYKYGMGGARFLALFPFLAPKAIRNADNYQFFAESI